MHLNSVHSYAIEVNLKEKAISIAELKVQRRRLKAVYKNQLNYIVALIVLGISVTYRAVSLNYDNDFELLNISLYIGIWFGLFTGLMIDGDGKRHLQMIIVGIVVSTSASLFAAMLLTLAIGGTVTWITSVNIIGSALGSMWILTSYDEVVKGFDAIRTVDNKQLHYMQKAASNFTELNQYHLKISEENRMPVIAEYWAMHDWIQNKIQSNKNKVD